MQRLSKILTESILVLVVSLLTAVSAQAENYIGKLHFNGDKQPVTLILRESGARLLIETKPDLDSNLRLLKTGDTIACSGRLSNDSSRLYLESIERIGLQGLLGAWQSSGGKEIFEFLTYDNLNVYVPTVDTIGAVRLAQTRALKYVLTPENGSRFSIFMTNQSGDVRMAFLAFEKKRLALWLTNNSTGQTTEKISLSPFYMH